MAIGKVAAVGVSLILVVGVVIGVVASVGYFGHKNGDSSSGAKSDDTHMSAGMKAVTTICGPTEYKEACIRTLSPVAANNGSTNPKDLVKAAIQVALDEVQKAVEHSMSLANDDKIINNNATLKEALGDCKEYLEYAIDDLQDAVSMVVNNDLHNMNDLAPELQNWLSAVLSFKETCLDGLDVKPELKSAMLNNGITNATEFTTNALGIVGEITEILKTFNIPINMLKGTSNSRRLLAENVDADGYPTWFKASDRKLLAVKNNGGVKPNAVVAQDGSGQFKTIAAALAAYPKNNVNNARYVIYVKAGIYDEYITITKDQHNIFMYGDGPTKTIVTGRKNTGLDGIKTDKSASFAVIGSDFICRSMGFRNTAGPEGHQAVALRVQSDRSAFFNCRIDGYQDTLYVQAHRQFYRNCIISGTIDFIFGDSATLIQNSLIIVRKPMDNQLNTITAHGRTKASSTTGLVIQNCQIVPEKQLFPVRFKIKSYLGRPWKEYSRTVFMECAIGDFINSDGWYPWSGDFAINTLYYAEYANSGPGANTNRRVRWKGFHVIRDRREALKFTATEFIRGQYWLKSTGVPFMLGLTH
ncbi:Pectinesterase [Macleaya cordata]|uniref:Pectinesterase n=1 Tax=Macleaya cordata TaxID=56857 RepID=A0A200R1Q2_MACCD|nr:Pectinesterase [Macleaya cordata]